MIYYLMFFAFAVCIDFKELKSSNKKADVIFYILSMTLALGLAIIYYINPNRIGVSEYLVRILNLGGM